MSIRSNKQIDNLWEGRMYDLSYLEKISDNDQSFIKDILKTFDQNGTELLEAIDRLWSQSNTTQLSRMVHKFIPSLNFIGVKDFKPDLKLLEVELLDVKDTSAIEGKLTQVKENLNELLKKLNEDFDLNE